MCGKLKNEKKSKNFQLILLCFSFNNEVAEFLKIRIFLAKGKRGEPVPFFL